MHGIFFFPHILTVIIASVIQRLRTFLFVRIFRSIVVEVRRQLSISIVQSFILTFIVFIIKIFQSVVLELWLL